MNKITIIGSGAVGAMYGLRLHQLLGKETVVFLADEQRRKRYAEEDLFLNGEKVDFTFVDPKDAEPSDLVILATKNLQLEEAVKQIQHAVGKHTVILSLLNGIESEEKLSQVYGEAHVLYGFAVGLNSTHIGNRIDFSKEGRIVLGRRTTARANAYRLSARYSNALTSRMWYRRIYAWNCGRSSCSTPPSIPSAPCAGQPMAT